MQNNTFFLLFVLNRDILLNMLDNFFKIDMPIFNTIVEGTLSQIVYGNPRFYFTNIENRVENTCSSFPFF